MDNLGYFKSIPVPKGHEEVLKALEDVLQQQHGPDGKHPIATSSQDGFISADDKGKLDQLWNIFKKTLVP